MANHMKTTKFQTEPGSPEGLILNPSTSKERKQILKDIMLTKIPLTKPKLIQLSGNKLKLTNQ